MRIISHLQEVCLKNRQLRIACMLLAILICMCSHLRATEQHGLKRRITVKDTIEMTEFADRGYFLGGTPTSPVAIFSPDQKRFLIRLKQGNVERNVVEYRLLLYETEKALTSSSGKVILQMSSSSNREAIQEVRWLDNETIAFLGENAGTLPQVFRMDIPSDRILQLTHHPTAVVAYDISRDGQQIVFEAAPGRTKSAETEQALRHGVVIDSQSVDELLDGGGERDDPRIDRELFVQHNAEEPVRVPSADFLTEYLPLKLSPDGRFAVLAVYVSAIPKEWEGYEDLVLRPYIVEKRKPGTLSNVEQYMLVDVQHATMRPLLDAPKAWLDEGIAWSHDSRFVVVSGTFLPLNFEDTPQHPDVRKHPFVVEVKIPTFRIQAITGERVCISNGEALSKRIILQPGYGAPGGPAKIFEEVDNHWHEVPAFADASDNPSIEVGLEEDSNTPPRIFAKDRKTGKKILLIDLNPQLREFALAKVETIRWKATDGHEVEGGLYYPPGFERGRRYPLVIQTHGYDPERFWVNGPWNSAFAAQPLAAEGFVVLQVGDSVEQGGDRKYVNTPAEGPRRMAAFEGAIDELDRRGLIDRDRVGIIGFSRTAFHVAFTLTHSSYKFRAAVLADGFEAGYLGYLLWRTTDFEGVNGGKPIGLGLNSWFEKCPAFQIEKVATPVRLEYYGPLNFLGGWEWFSRLSLLDKPVDFLWLPRGTHLLVKPWERMASEQGTVDWLRFWLFAESGCKAEAPGACDRYQELAVRSGLPHR
jgi:dipeptidyl aminopeptidase/acylaminoacyl peptidase